MMTGCHSSSARCSSRPTPSRCRPHSPDPRRRRDWTPGTGGGGALRPFHDDPLTSAATASPRNHRARIRPRFAEDARRWSHSRRGRCRYRLAGRHGALPGPDAPAASSSRLSVAAGRTEEERQRVLERLAIVEHGIPVSTSARCQWFSTTRRANPELLGMRRNMK